VRTNIEHSLGWQEWTFRLSIAAERKSLQPKSVSADTGQLLLARDEISIRPAVYYALTMPRLEKRKATAGSESA